MTQSKGRKSDGGADRFEAARRNRDDQPTGFAFQNSAELMRHGFDVPIAQETVPTRDDGEYRLNKRVEIRAQDGSDYR